jgi:hypothetical protein
MRERMRQIGGVLVIGNQASQVGTVVEAFIPATQLLPRPAPTVSPALTDVGKS